MRWLCFVWWRLRVCEHVYANLGHWPWSDITVVEWREIFEDGLDPYEAFLEGWIDY